MPASTNSEYSVYVHSENKKANPLLVDFKISLFESLSSNGHKLLMLHKQEVADTILVNTGDRRLVVFCEDVPALQAARDAYSHLRGIIFSLIVLPTSYPSWGIYSDAWDEGLIENTDVDTIILTDSELSRRVIESHLHHLRADVHVVHPKNPGQRDVLVDGSVEKHVWNFQRAKFSNTDEKLSFSGVDWGFRASEICDSNSGLSGPAADSDVRFNAKFSLENDATMAALLRPKMLEGNSVRIGILGTKLTFIDELSRDLARNSGSLIELDEWPHLSAPPDKKRALEILESSDVIIGEWARPNNFWIQKNANENKRLIVRAHRYEVTVDFPRKIDMERYFGGVVIVPWVGRALVQKFGWPSEKMVYIPNYVNSRYFDRPKLDGAEFTLGIVGITPDLKRLDLAIDLLERLRMEDLRYALRVRGNLPPEHINWNKQPLQSEQWGSILHRIESNPLLRNAIHFDAPGRDMASWYQQIGVILSTSDLEGSHVALAEGIASGALPVARRWPGIETLWPEDFIFDDLESAAEFVLDSRSLPDREERIRSLQKLKCLDQDLVLQAWWDLTNGRIDKAQEAFGPIDWEAPLYEKIQF